MGRYVTPSTMRNQRMVLTDSNPALPVPAWAKVARISGCGGGAGGNNVTTANVCGGGGGAGGAADDLLFPLSGATMAITIGAGGAGAAPGGNGPVTGYGALGGATQVVCGGRTLTLHGGQSDLSGTTIHGTGGSAHYGPSTADADDAVLYPTNGNGPLRSGANGSDGDAAGSVKKGSGGHSMFGNGGLGMAGNIPADRPGQNGGGYGSGGGGGNGNGGGGAGAPGILIIEFLESL